MSLIICLVLCCIQTWITYYIISLSEGSDTRIVPPVACLQLQVPTTGMICPAFIIGSKTRGDLEVSCEAREVIIFIMDFPTSEIKAVRVLCQ